MGMLQACYDTKLISQKLNASPKPDVTKLRRILFWDTDFDKIDWQLQKNAVIQRIWERGNEREKQLIQLFYGNDQIEIALLKLPQSRFRLKQDKL